MNRARDPLRLVVRGGRLLDVDAHRAEPADVLVEGDTIRAVGPPGLPAPADARVIDARGRLLVPGLVNAHTHGHGNLARGLGDRWTLELLINAGPWLSGGRLAEDAYLSTLLGAVEMVKRGCTACYDLCVELPAPTADGILAVARAYEAVGMRAMVAPMVADLTLYEAIPGLMDVIPDDLRPGLERARRAPPEVSLGAVRDAVSRWPFDRDRVRPALAPTIPLLCTDPFLAACRNLARELAIPLHTHLAESKAQAVAGLVRYGRSITAHLDAAGLLGPDLTVAHAVWLDADDIARLAATGTSVAHNPGSNMRLGSGIAPVRAMLAAGVTVALGTDGSQCSDHQNVFEAMRLASLASRVLGLDYPSWLATEEVLAMATTGGARALGLAGAVGRIAPGFKADIVLLDLADVNYLPLNDPTNQIVHGESGVAVESVVIGGRLVVEGGRLTTLDESALPAMAEAAALRLARANEGARRTAERLAPVVGRACRRLAREPSPINRYGAGDWLATPVD